MLPFAEVSSIHIRFLLHTFTDSNFDSVFSQLSQFLDDYGCDGSIIVLRACLDHMQYSSDDQEDTSIQLKHQLLSAIFRYLLRKPNFSTVLCQALRNTVVSHELLLRIVLNECKFSVSERIAIGLALSDSEEIDVRCIGQSFCLSQIEELCANSNDTCEVASLRQLDLFYESSENDLDDILGDIEKEMTVADIVKELGYGCTVNTSHCKDILSLFLPLTEVTISRILSMMARTHVGLEDSHSTHSTFCSAVGISWFADSTSLSSWNVDALVESIKQLTPDTNWVHVMENLDHESCYFPSEDSFSLFMSVYASACQDPFPLHAICGAVWNNAEGQISFLRYAVSASPEIFTFEHSARQLVYVDPVHGPKLSTGNGNQAWLFLDLVDVLCQLAETGHAGSVRSMLEYPLKHCPELLLLGLSQTATAYNLLQYEVLSSIFPMALTNFSRAVILHLWNVNPDFILWGLLDGQNLNSESMLKTFDICKDLKILPAVLDMAPFSFSIKLAALASRKEQINLENWLHDKLSTWGETFVGVCVMFLKDILCAVPQDVPPNPSQLSSALANAYLETVPIFIQVLLGHAEQNDSCHHLLEEMKTFHAVFIQNSTELLNGGAAGSASSDGGYPDDIEGEATSNLEQMFSGQLSIDAMVQMLTRYKKSSEKREQSIYEYTIGILFHEYKFLPKYPERQLQIDAILFGSLIKHQLVTQATLDIALCGVLSALRTPADPKMFVFGAMALAQFVDRLVEWPQYCNHILQISQLRETHLELVTVIERAVAMISSSHSESNRGSSFPIDQHQGPNPVPSENMEVSESSWKIMKPSSSSTLQARLQPSFQFQQRYFLEDRRTAGNSLGTPSVESFLCPTRQQLSLVSAHVAAGGTQEACIAQPLAIVPYKNAPIGPATVSSYPVFLCPSQGTFSTCFGSTSTIETPLAAPEGVIPVEDPKKKNIELGASPCGVYLTISAVRRAVVPVSLVCC